MGGGIEKDRCKREVYTTLVGKGMHWIERVEGLEVKDEPVLFLWKAQPFCGSQTSAGRATQATVDALF
jgi:hypothetical protein